MTAGVASSKRRWGAGRLPWPVRGVIAGTVGTAAMTFAYGAERRFRPEARGPLDYDDSLVPGEIVAKVLRLPSTTSRQEYALGLLLRWGYGSAFGMFHGALRRVVREPYASLIFGSVLMTATLSLFPILGGTPPPWRWPRAVLATAFSTHAAYVAGVAVTDFLLASAASDV